MTQKDPQKATSKKANPETKPSFFEAVATNNTTANTIPPTYHALDRGNPEEIKTCRICLESDQPEDMIAPCRCKGGSRWVHRKCLDEWRIHETDRAFAKCTECLFEYHMEQKPNKKHRKTKYYLMVTRDLCGATLVLQLLIAGIGFIAYLMDTNGDLPTYINAKNPVVTYYLFGFIGLLCLLGVFGCILLCYNGCSVGTALEAYPELGLARAGEQPSYEARSTHYQARRSRSRSNHNGMAGCDVCCYDCRGCHNPSPYYYGDPGACCHCCCWCCDDESIAGGTHAARSSSDECCECSGCNGDSGSSDCGEALLVLLVILAFFMAIVGFLVGMIVVVIIFQRTAQRHAYLIHKQQLASEFQVVDLSKYDLDRPFQDDTQLKEVDEEKAQVYHPPPSAPQLPAEDTIYLKDMGLL